MHLYDFKAAPNPRRVRIFLAEKGLELPSTQVDLGQLEQFSEAFRAHNPYCTVPALELDDGTCIHEVVAICRYVEEVHPEPALLGRSPEEKARIAMWDHHMAIDGMLAVAEVFRNILPFFEDRALPGPRPFRQLPELVERGRQRFGYFLEDLDRRLREAPFVAGDAFSVADITALVAVEFGQRAKLEVPDALGNLARWHHAMRERPSAAA